MTIFAGAAHDDGARLVPRYVPGAETYTPELPGSLAKDVEKAPIPVAAIVIGTCWGWISMAAALYLAGGHFG